MSTKRVCDRCGLVLEDYTGYHVRIDDESLDKHPTRDIKLADAVARRL